MILGNIACGLSAGAVAFVPESVADIPIGPVVVRETGGAGLRELYAYPRASWLVVLIWFGGVTAIFGVPGHRNPWA